MFGDFEVELLGIAATAVHGVEHDDRRLLLLAENLAQQSFHGFSGGGIGRVIDGEFDADDIGTLAEQIALGTVDGQGRAGRANAGVDKDDFALRKILFPPGGELSSPGELAFAGFGAGGNGAANDPDDDFFAAAGALEDALQPADVTVIGDGLWVDFRQWRIGLAAGGAAGEGHGETETQDVRHELLLYGGWNIERAGDPPR